MLIYYVFCDITLLTKENILAFFSSEILFDLFEDMTALNISDSFPFITGVILILVDIFLILKNEYKTQNVEI